MKGNGTNLKGNHTLKKEIRHLIGGEPNKLWLRICNCMRQNGGLSWKEMSGNQKNLKGNKKKLEEFERK